jgi:hypothetical protein
MEHCITQNLNPLAVQAYLKGARYPSRKGVLLRIATTNRAPTEVLNALRHIHDRNYRTPAELTREVSRRAHPLTAKNNLL